MRLTLRTLLAYLDDILEPAQAREIGRKVQDAPVAKELITRIRDVVRKRRLKAPAVEGAESGLDPNVVAEYLDNQLSPAQVAQTERILLNSEIHLAETASAHQILTLVLGEPVEVLSDSRQRMYALGPVSDSDKLIVEDTGAGPAVIEPSDRLAVSKSSPTRSENGTVNSSDAGVELAEYVKSQQKKRAWWPVVGVGLLIGLFVALWWTDPEKKPAASDGTFAAGSNPIESGSDSVASAVPAVDSADAAINNNMDSSQDVASTDTTPDQPNESNNDTEQSPPIVAATNGIDAPAPPDAPDTTDVSPDPSEPAMAEPADTTSVAVEGVEPTDKPEVTLLGPPGAEEPMEDAATGMPAAPSAPVVVDMPADQTEEPAGPKSIGTRLTYLDSNGILLRETVDEGWRLVTVGASVGDNDRIAAPRPYVARFAVPDTPLQLHLAAGSRMSTYASPNAAMGIRLERGRVVISRGVEDEAADDAAKPVDQPDEPIAVRIAVGEKRWTLQLPSSPARIAIDVTPVPPIRLDKNLDGFPFKVWAVGSLGDIALESADGDERNIGSEDRIALAGPKAGEVLVEPGLATDWLVGKDPVAGWVAGPTAPTDKRDAIRFAKEFGPTDSVGEAMPALLKHERSWMARRAVQCLSLTQDHVALVSALAIAEHDEATAEAILGLREWLSSEPGNGEKLMAALDHEYTEQDSQTMYQLLWGYDEGHARDQKASRELVRWLSHDRPAVQRLAYFHILRLTGMQDEYRPSLTRDRLNSFRKRWERQIEKNGTLLKE
ncbi:MAG: hypothetical protein AB8G99_13295 [Planctomycetaceae bacterium]